MPECFRAEFEDKVAVIIDCFEVYIQRPSNLLSQFCTWSYKQHNTVKLLIGITLQDVISLISDAWGGVSDKSLTERCGILNKLLHAWRYCSCRLCFRYLWLSWHATGSPTYCSIYNGENPAASHGSRTNMLNCECVHSCRESYSKCLSKVLHISKNFAHRQCLWKSRWRMPMYLLTHCYSLLCFAQCL